MHAPAAARSGGQDLCLVPACQRCCKQILAWLVVETRARLCSTMPVALLQQQNWHAVAGPLASMALQCCLPILFSLHKGRLGEFSKGRTPGRKLGEGRWAVGKMGSGSAAGIDCCLGGSSTASLHTFLFRKGKIESSDQPYFSQHSK